MNLTNRSVPYTPCCPFSATQGNEWAYQSLQSRRTGPYSIVIAVFTFQSPMFWFWDCSWWQMGKDARRPMLRCLHGPAYVVFFCNRRSPSSSGFLKNSLHGRYVCPALNFQLFIGLLHRVVEEAVVTYCHSSTFCYHKNAKCLLPYDLGTPQEGPFTAR